MSDNIHTFFFLGMFALFLAIQPMDGETVSMTGQLRLWEGPAPGVPENTGPEVDEPNGRVSHVSVPTLDIYVPAKPNGSALVICSGGGYTRLATLPLGMGAAEEFLNDGFTVFSLKYRLSPPSTDPVTDAHADAARAMRLIRSHADTWNVRPDRVGMLGFSAGSNVILNLVLQNDPGNPFSKDPVERFSSRPDFVVLACAWRKNLNLETFRLKDDAPPALLLHARDDTTAPFSDSEKLEKIWQNAGIPVRFERYENGGHMGFNFPQPPNKDWPVRFRAWYQTLFLHETKGP